MLRRDIQRKLDEFSELLQRDYPYFIGFPGAVDFDYSELYDLFDYLLNNVGDPYENALHTNQSKWFEQNVIDFFGDMFRAPKDDRWGYVTNGGSEGNLYALYVARSIYPDAIVMYSDAAHYSIPKNLHLLRMEGVSVACDDSGEMDYSDLRSKMAEHKDSPVIVLATIGTTMTEAKDNLRNIKQVLLDLEIKRHYIHCDAALAGPYAALISPRHPFDFEDGADSVSVSGHKFIGSPMPCGVVVVRKKYVDAVTRDSLYVGASDTTITGSRNGHTPIMLWYTLNTLGREGLLKRAIEGINLAQYLNDRLISMGWKTIYNENALTVVMDTPSQEIVHKWQLATYRGKSHIICMPGVTKDRIDLFLSDIKQEAPDSNR